MTACSSKLQQCSYVAESTWGEASTSMTSAQILPISAMFDLTGLQRAMIASSRVVTLKDERPLNIPGPWTGASFVVELELTGHGATTAGATSLVAVEDFLGWAFGTAVVSAANGTTASGTGTTTTTTTTASATFTAGLMVREGAKNDARADAQWNNVTSHVTTTLTKKFATAAATVSTDVVYSAANFYTNSTSCAQLSKRFRLMTADGQWVCHGCFPSAAVITGYNPGEVLKAQVTIMVSWLEPVSATFPDVTSTAAWTFNPAPIAGGSIQLAAYGATTRTVLDCRSLNLGVSMGMAPIVSYAGVSSYQTIAGASRTPDAIKLTLIVGAAGASATPTYYDLWQANAAMHALLSLTVGTGSAVGCYLRRLVWAGPQPMQIEHNGLNCVQLEFDVSSDTAGTTEPTRAAMVWGFS